MFAAVIGRMREDDLVLIDLFKVDSLDVGGLWTSELDLDFGASSFPLRLVVVVVVVVPAFFEDTPSDNGGLPLASATINILGLLTPVELTDLSPPFLLTWVGGADSFFDGGLGGRAEVKDFRDASLLLEWLRGSC